ncbi:hypothetical protein C1646_775006 [Rhizophagus diaphanus]|nr:hypothetical protein C1646_775006 [Rhizophagus diaphanus] [Rhizophagus sp. MUCL 43196]
MVRNDGTPDRKKYLGMIRKGQMVKNPETQEEYAITCDKFYALFKKHYSQYIGIIDPAKCTSPYEEYVYYSPIWEIVRNDATPNDKKFLDMKNEWGYHPSGQIWYNDYCFSQGYIVVRGTYWPDMLKWPRNPKYYSIHKKYNYAYFIRISDYKKYRSKSVEIQNICDSPTLRTYYILRKYFTVNFLDLDNNCVSSLQSIKESKQEEPLTKNKIETNLRVLNSNLKNSKAPYAHHFRKYLKKKSASDLSWRVPLASQVICADSEIVRTLEVDAYNFYMDPAKRMKVTASDLVKNNSSLKNLPIGKSGYISTAEHQSIASKDRRGVGKQPDENDRVKTWKEMNDGMYWAHKGCKPDKDDFVEILIQPTDRNTVFKFVETLLIIQNILHVNISILYYVLPTSSSSNTENSSTVSSPPRLSSPPKMKKRNMQSEIDETDSLKICIARLEVENAELRKKFAEIEVRNAELKARIAKLEDKQLQNEIVKNLLSVSQKT